ncbi:hypothetical protein [Streptomyces kanasensis]|uniref:hypothetical protein n=1 Tax=Streptomyces kanasensis TaxID=936756 RepID=UPI0037F929AD
MQPNHQHRPPDGNTRFHRLQHWFTRRRRIMTTNALRGACYGLAAGAAGTLVTYWIERHLQ